MTTKVKQGGNPTAGEMNALAALFNQGKLDLAEKMALEITQCHPKQGVGWKVLGAIYQSQGLAQTLDVLKKAAECLPDDYEAHYNLGNCFYDKQQLDSAAACYQKAIQLNSSFAPAHYNLGNVFKNQDSLEQAEQNYRNALLLDVDNVWILDNLAHVLYEQSRFAEAKACYEKILTIQPDFIAAQTGLGAVAKALGQSQEAEARFRKAIENAAGFEAYGNLADLLHSADRIHEAEACLNSAILAYPESVDAYVKMAIFLRTLGRAPESIPYFTQALSIDSSRKDIHVDLGVAKADEGFFSEAEACYRRAIELDPDYWLAYNNLGLVWHRMERHKDSEQAFEKAIELHPEEALLYSNLGLTLGALGQLKKAELTLKKAVEISPEYVNAHINLCINYIGQGRLEEAEAECFEALKYDPASNKARSNLLFAMNYSGHHSAEYRLQQALEFDNVVTGKVEQAYTSWQSHPDSRRLRIGLMSGDLRQHPVAYFLENWVRNVDFSQFELIAYLTDTREDAFTGRLKPNFAHWKSLVGLTDQAAAELIHDDGIDILLDLSGHTSGNRLQILAWKPAPIQVSWLGYFATTGMKAVDYFIADEIGVPKAHQQHFIEKIKYLPDTRLCFTAPHVAVDVSALPALNNGYITFASFQTLAKAGDDVLALWAEVMLALPDAKLRWQCKSFCDADVTTDMVARFAKLGITADRLALLGSVSREAYFVAHHEVDIILDTFPYPGGTTTCEALWMGVPTLTLAGGSLIARQGASMLSAAGLTNWIAETKAEYLSRALALCSDLNQLANLRAKLRAQVLASPLFDAKRFAKNMEIALWEMWHQHYPADDASKVVPDIVSTNIEVQYKALTREAYEQKMKAHQGRHVQIVSATRYSETDFWSKSALGLSLHRHVKQDSGMSASIVFNNTLGLSDVFNQAIERADDGAILVFVHDDVWIDEANFVDTLIAGLERFDVIGVAGNKRRLPNQPAWLFVDTALNWDEPEYLSGTVSHGLYAFGEDKFYGDVPAACELLDGVFIATTKSALNGAHIRFDHQFDFHLYDVDFCRSAREAGLSLGTWPIKLTHQSKGAFGSPHWAQKCQLYFNKWESGSSQQIALQHAMLEVMQMAERHEAAGELEQAALLYQEVLNIQPDNAEANYHLGIVEFNLNGVHTALPHLEKAVQCKLAEEQYWITYIDALMQSADVATVLEALELGQKFGLTKETAQIIAEQLDKKSMYKSADKTSREDAINHENIHIYQIYYSEQTKLSNDGGFIGLDNLVNERPDWREYWPIRNYLLSNELNDNHFYGFLSPKFKDKTNLSSADVYHFVNEHLDVDVILFSPFFDQSSLFKNMFDQGAEAHAGIKEALIASVSKVAPEVDIAELVMDSSTTIFCNYIVAKPAFWREWFKLCDVLFKEAEGSSTELSIALNALVKHDGGVAPTKVFVIERIASLILATQSHWVSKAYDSKLLPCSNDVLAKYMIDLIQLDSLKTAYLSDFSGEHLSNFIKLRQLIIDDVNVKRNTLLQQSMQDVLKMAEEHQNMGRTEQALHLYSEILQVQPRHPVVNHSLGLLELGSKGAIAILPRLEIAIQEDPENEAYWVDYLTVLMPFSTVDAFLNFLELGQQHGLTSREAQKLAARFMKEVSLLEGVLSIDTLCPVCNIENMGFAELPSIYKENALKYGFSYFGQGEMTALETYSCHHCGASDRERLYAYWVELQLKNSKLTNQTQVIHFAPEAALSSKLKKINFKNYSTADLMMDGCDYQVDIMYLPFEDNMFDFFICSHVLEHVESDDKAVSELYRITRKGGCGLLMAPIAVGLRSTLEDSAVTSEAERWKSYGQDDHVWLYAHDDYVAMLCKHGFSVEQLGESFFGKDIYRKLGLKSTSILYVVSK
ncbi:MAG: tetratricopeptide repeat protein [Methylotenera sp.]|nr:tetratricopeptide repeat protein [Methylotenera sp.]MDP1753956.1 tetratricopeptide repeat protein [Methylotenera sp.]MDP1959276.1 tetratricopeptide repeat protein [Methylotenera sp.]MDP3943916.1 tetratricopeptide repeat protein [Methylotenera sp.]